MRIRNSICTNGAPVMEYIPENEDDREEIFTMMLEGTIAPSPIQKELEPEDPEAIQAVDHDVSQLNLWDTNSDKAVLVMSAKGKEMTIHDEALWNRFLAEGKE